MKLVKALTELKMARSGAEANRLVKQGSVWIGGCKRGCPCRGLSTEIEGCTCEIIRDQLRKELPLGTSDFDIFRAEIKRRSEMTDEENLAIACKIPHGTCTCGGWHKATNPIEEVPSGQVIRIKDGSWRLLTRMDGTQGFDQVIGIARIPEDNKEPIISIKGSFFDTDELQIKFWKIIFFIRDKFLK